VADSRDAREVIAEALRRAAVAWDINPADSPAAARTCADEAIGDLRAAGLYVGDLGQPAAWSYWDGSVVPADGFDHSDDAEPLYAPRDAGGER
jgi:hypothetical protein